MCFIPISCEDIRNVAQECGSQKAQQRMSTEAQKRRNAVGQEDTEDALLLVLLVVTLAPVMQI